jgi:hypothetical protein
MLAVAKDDSVLGGHALYVWWHSAFTFAVRKQNRKWLQRTPSYYKIKKIKKERDLVFPMLVLMVFFLQAAC